MDGIAPGPGGGVRTTVAAVAWWCVRAWAWVTVLATAGLLILGGVVTTFRVGMSDPVWPTAPWYLAFASWTEPRPGFLIEHTHRLLAFIVGAAVSLLAVALWATERRGWRLWAGLGVIFGLLYFFGQLHRDLMAQKESADFHWPTVSAAGLLACTGLALAAAVAAVASREAGRWLRALGVVALLAVMVQGLLGGFRVRFNELAGTDLAAVHGVFGQLVFAFLVCLAVGMARPRPAEPLAGGTRILALTLAGVAVTQLVWGALVRHNATPLAQRLHLLTAFGVAGLAVWFAAAVAGDPAARRRLGFVAGLLVALVVVQVALGVEAWLGRFPPGVDPETLPITRGRAIVRTAHQTVGTWVLAASTVAAVLALAAPRRSATTSEPTLPLAARPARQLGEAV